MAQKEKRIRLFKRKEGKGAPGAPVNDQNNNDQEKEEEEDLVRAASDSEARFDTVVSLKLAWSWWGVLPVATGRACVCDRGDEGEVRVGGDGRQGGRLVGDRRGQGAHRPLGSSLPRCHHRHFLSSPSISSPTFDVGFNIWQLPKPFTSINRPKQNHDDTELKLWGGLFVLDNLLVSCLPAFHSSRCLFTKPELSSFYPKRSITHTHNASSANIWNCTTHQWLFTITWFFGVKIFTKINIFCGELANYNKILACPRLARSACPLLSCNPTVTSATDRPSKNVSGKYCHNSCQ